MIMKKILCFFLGHKIEAYAFKDSLNQYQYTHICKRCGSPIGMPRMTDEYIKKTYPVPPRKDIYEIDKDDANKKKQNSDAVMDYLCGQMTFLKINCDGCFFYNKEKSYQINEAKTIFKNQIGISKETKYYATCKIHNYDDICFANNYGCINYHEKENFTYLLENGLVEKCEPH